MNHSNHWQSRFVKLLLFVTACLLVLGLVWKIQGVQNNKSIVLSLYPDGKNFAFTITDDPDANTLEKIKPVYDYLAKVGIKSSVAVWIAKAKRTSGMPDTPSNFSPGDTCERKEYLAYIKSLHQKGFEIALHGATRGNDPRDVTIRGYQKFRGYFGTYPKINIMHSQNLENVYWGKKVFGEGILGRLVGLVIKNSNLPFQGEEYASPYFWGDILKTKTKYVRLWGTSDINTLKFNSSMPYHDAEKPYVNYWFSFSDGFGVAGFNNLISKDNVDKLVKERGACIAYTHFAHGFVREGKLNETFQRRINYLVSQPDGWFVPASVLLDRLLLMKRVILVKGQGRLMVVNLNNVEIEGVTVIVPSGQVWYGLDGRNYEANDEGEIILETLEAGSAVVLLNNKSSAMKKEQLLNFIDFQDAIYIAKKIGAKLERLPSQITSVQPLFDVFGREVIVTENGQVLASAWIGEKEMVLFKNKRALRPKKQQLRRWEYLNMVFQRILVYLKHNREAMSNI